MRPFASLACSTFTICVLSAPSPAEPAPLFERVARGGDAFPGRPGYTYRETVGSPFIGARTIDAGGDVFFQAFGLGPTGNSVTDLLVYRRATGIVEPYVQSGQQIGGMAARMFWGAVGGATPGDIAHLAVLEDPTYGDRISVVVSHADGTHSVAARDLDQPPGYPLPAGFTNIGMTSGSFLDVNMNRTGVVGYGGRYLDQNNTQRYGYYLTRPGGAPERIIDSTMPVPEHPNAEWRLSDNILAPFDEYTPGLDQAGNTYFRAKYRDAGQDYYAFYQRTGDGSVTPIVDTFSSTVPGAPGDRFTRFPTAANNQAGDVAFGAEAKRPNNTFYSGVFVSRAGGPLETVLKAGDPLPGIPEAPANHLPSLAAMNESGHVLVRVNYFLNGLGGQSLVLMNPDGTGEPVLKFNQVPGFPGQRAGLNTGVELNALGDAVFVTRMNMQAENYAAFAYLSDSNTLVPLLKTGDMLDGLTVVNFHMGGGIYDPLGEIGASGGAFTFDDARNLTLSVLLKDAAGGLHYSLYAVQVPEPGAAAIAAFALLGLTARRRGT